jgi:hypothetical protein
MISSILFRRFLKFLLLHYGAGFPDPEYDLQSLTDEVLSELGSEIE